LGCGGGWFNGSGGRFVAEGLESRSRCQARVRPVACQLPVRRGPQARARASGSRDRASGGYGKSSTTSTGTGSVAVVNCSNATGGLHAGRGGWGCCRWCWTLPLVMEADGGANREWWQPDLHTRRDLAVPTPASGVAAAVEQVRDDLPRLPAPTSGGAAGGGAGLLRQPTGGASRRRPPRGEQGAARARCRSAVVAAGARELHELRPPPTNVWRAEGSSREMELYRGCDRRARAPRALPVTGQCA
jgi:hypothetical protein